MLTWEIFNEDLLWLEIYACAAFMASLGAWVIFRKIPISIIGLVIVASIVLIGGFRQFDYNSDTSNYYSYLYLLSFVNGGEIFFLTKLEPLHSALILLIRDFRLWFLTEAAIQVVGLFLSFKVRRNDYSYLILCAFIITLNTSALRYCSSLIFFYYFLSRGEVGLVKAARMTVILCCFHITMLLSGALAVRRRLVLVGISVICLLIYLESWVLGARIEIDLTEASTGLKSLAATLLAVAYLFVRSPKKSLRFLPLYTLAFLSIFLISSTTLPTFNRFLIMGLLVVLSYEWAVSRGEEENDIFDRGFVFLIGGVIVLPFMINLPRLFYSGVW